MTKTARSDSAGANEAAQSAVVQPPALKFDVLAADGCVHLFVTAGLSHHRLFVEADLAIRLGQALIQRAFEAQGQMAAKAVTEAAVSPPKKLDA